MRLLIGILLLLAAGSALAQTPEPTGAPEASAVRYGEIITGELTDNMPQTRYQFQGKVGDVVHIRLQADDFDAYLTLENADGTALTRDDDSGSGTNPRITYRVEADGTYTVVVDSFDHRTGNPPGTGSYTLSLRRDAETIPEPATPEATQEPSSESTIAYDDALQGRLTTEAGRAAYNFRGERGDVVTITLTSETFDAYLILYGPDEAEVARNDDAAGDTGARIGPIELPQTGTYTIAATSYGRAEEGTTENGGYVLRLEAARVLPVDSDAPATGEINRQKPSQVYRFDGEAGQIVSINLETESPSVYMRVDGDEHIDAQTYGGSGVIGPLVLPTDGNYIISVSSYDQFAPMPYTLFINRMAPRPLRYDQPVTDSFEDAAGAVYTFEGKANAAVDIRVHSEAGADTRMTLIAPSGQVFASDDDGGAGLSPELNGVILPTDGTYALLLEPYIVGDDAPFTVTLSDPGARSLDDGTQVLRISDKVHRASVTFDGTAGETVQLAARMIGGQTGEPLIVARQGESVLATNPVGDVARLLIEFTVPDDGPVDVIVTDDNYGGFVLELALTERTAEPE